MLRVGVVSVLVLLVLAATPAPVSAADGPTIAPGDLLIVNDASLCTLNFVFDGVGSLAGRVFIGTAAHCISGDRDATLHQETGGSLRSGPRNANFASVFWLGDYPNSVNGGTAVENGIPGTQLDFALLEVRADLESKVLAEVRGQPGMPMGYSTSTQTRFGEVILHSGNGVAWSETAQTRQNHPGILYEDSPTRFVEIGTTLPGDSGGPVLLASGKALGVVSGIQPIAVPPASDYGPTIEGILAELALNGVTVKLRDA